MALAGAGNVLMGLFGWYLVARGGLVPLVVANLPPTVDEVTIVANAPLLVDLIVVGVPLFGTVSILVGGVQFSASRRAYHARSWTQCVGASVVGLVNPVTAPLSLVAVVLLTLAQNQFAASN